MSSERECYVYIVLPGSSEFITAGRLRVSKSRDGTPVGSFVYGRSYRERTNAVEIDPVELRLSTEVYETARMEGMFGAIRDSMPDYWGRLVIERSAGLAQLEEFDYLLQGPDDRAGALGFGLNVEPPAPRRLFNRTLDLGALQQAADAIAANDPNRGGSTARQVEALLNPGTSMGGARPKAVVQDDHELWIAKFSRNDDRWNYPRVEHAMLQLARACGLHVAESRIETVGERVALLVRRFDRDWADTGYQRHRMVSALTLLRSDDTAAERRNWSYLVLADEIRRVSSDPQADLRELFARMCFNAAVSNIDDHPRNHVILARGRDWRLSPAFDLVPFPEVSIERRDLAMICGRFGRYANRANILSTSGRFLLTDAVAKATFDRVVTTVREQWRGTLRRAEVSETECNQLSGAFVYDGLFLEATDAGK